MIKNGTIIFTNVTFTIAPSCPTRKHSVISIHDISYICID